MHRREQKLKYYSVKAEILWGNVLVMGSIFILENF